MSKTGDNRNGSDPEATLLARFVDDTGGPRLVPSFVCTLDLLGTSVGTLGEAQRNLEVTHNALERAARWSNELGDLTLTRWYTDNVLIAAPEDADGVWSYSCAAAVLLVASVQFELAMKGLFARGGLERGEFFASRRFLYGPALVQAHALEERVAVMPRVVLSSAAAHTIAVEVAAGTTSFPAEIYANLLAVDHDGVVFINYLGIARDIGAMNVLDDLRTHRGHLAERLGRHRTDDRIRAKLGWAADYHDRFCRALGDDVVPDGLLLGGSDGATLRSFGAEYERCLVEP
jgi:hypothetical protein